MTVSPSVASSLDDGGGSLAFRRETTIAHHHAREINVNFDDVEKPECRICRDRCHVLLKCTI